MTQPHNPLESPAGKPSLTVNLHDGSNEQVSIIVIHHNQPSFLNICLQSVYAMSNLNNYELIVVDNASNQESQEYLNVIEEEGIKVIRNEKNFYWSKAANQGMAVADPNSKYFIFLHADTVILDPAWIDVMINLSEGRSAGLVGTSLHSYYIQKQQVNFVQEYCMLITKNCWEDIGPWPEELPFVGMSFIMTLRAQYKGHNPQAIGNTIVHHYKSFIMEPSEYERMCEQAMGIVGKLMAAAQKS
jgi:glycosyltransferase involved in cell wall biosynthesis